MVAYIIYFIIVAYIFLYLIFINITISAPVIFLGN